MKKLILLPILALIAGFVFADTDPAFSGSFRAYMGYSLEEKKVQVQQRNKIDLKLNTTIDEWNTVAVTLDLEEKLTGTTDNNDNVLMIKDVYLTSDITGALGAGDSPVGLTIKVGTYEFKPATVANVAPKSTKIADGAGGTVKYVGLGVDIKFVDMITLSSVIYPENLGEIGDDSNTRFEGGAVLKGTGIGDMFDFALYFIGSGYAGADTKGMDLGANVAFHIDPVAIGLAFEYDIDAANTNKDGMKLQVDFKASLMENALVVGLSGGIAGLDYSDIAAKTSAKLSFTWQIIDNFAIFGGFGAGKFKDISDNLLYDIGFIANLQALAIQLGFSNNFDVKSPEGSFNNVLYLQFSTSF